MSARQTVSSPSLLGLLSACVLAGGTILAGRSVRKPMLCNPPKPTTATQTCAVTLSVAAVLTAMAITAFPASAQTANGGNATSPCATSGDFNLGGIGPTSSIACGRDSNANNGTGPTLGAGNTAIGGNSLAEGLLNTAVGSYSSATGFFTLAIGFNASATGTSSVALGDRSIADRQGTVSVGRPNDQRQIVNVAAGTEGTDAVNLDQMNAGDVATLASANGYTDTRETAIRADMVAGDAATLASANSYTDTREGAIRTDMAAGDAATLAAANTNADAGDVRTLASAMSYADAGDDRTLAAARSYTDAQVGGLETVMNARFRDVNVRLDQVTAMSAAFSSMAGNNAGAGTGASNRLVVGVGAYGGETALSVGYARAISRRTAFNAGVSFTGGEVMSGGSFGFAW